MSSYALSLLCECGARRSDGSRRWCAQCRYANATGEPSGVEVATSPWWKEPDGVLARVRGDAAVVREIIRVLNLPAAGSGDGHAPVRSSPAAAPGPWTRAGSRRRAPRERRRAG
jgi:hypothetical protein